MSKIERNIDRCADRILEVEKDILNGKDLESQKYKLEDIVYQISDYEGKVMDMDDRRALYESKKNFNSVVDLFMEKTGIQLKKFEENL